MMKVDIDKLWYKDRVGSWNLFKDNFEWQLMEVVDPPVEKERPTTSEEMTSAFERLTNRVEILEEARDVHGVRITKLESRLDGIPRIMVHGMVEARFKKLEKQQKWYEDKTHAIMDYLGWSDVKKVTDAKTQIRKNFNKSDSSSKSTLIDQTDVPWDDDRMIPSEYKISLEEKDISDEE